MRQFGRRRVLSQYLVGALKILAIRVSASQFPPPYVLPGRMLLQYPDQFGSITLLVPCGKERREIGGRKRTQFPVLGKQKLQFHLELKWGRVCQEDHQQLLIFIGK